MPEAARWGLCGFLVLVVGCVSTGQKDSENTGDEDGLLLSAETRALQELVAAEPANPEAHYRLGNALFDARRIPQALNLFQRTIQLDPGHAGAYCNLGLCYRLLGNMYKAVEAYEAALAISPDDRTVLQNLVIALRAKGDIEGLVGPLRHLAELEAHDVQVQSDLGRTLLELKRYEEAAVAFKRVLSLDPGFAGDYYNLGLSYFSLENWDAALAAWLTALAYDREHPALRKGLAVVYWKRGDYAQAWNEVAECQRLGVPLDPGFIGQLQRDSSQLGPE